MKKERFFELMNETDEALIERAEKYSAHNVNLRAHRIVRWTAIAACICMILIACIAVPIAMRMGDKGDLDIDDESTSSEAVGSIENENANPENDPIEDAYSSRPGVYREKDYPDMPGTDGLIYMLSPEKDAYYVCGYEGTDKEVYIPATHEDLPVTRVSPWGWNDKYYSSFRYNKNVTSVFVGKNVEIVDQGAFEGCTNLKKIVIPDSVRKVDVSSGCTSLSEIIISDLVEEVSIGSDTAFYKDKSNWINGILYLGNHILRAERVGATCTIREGTKTIQRGAFFPYQGVNDSLKSVIMPESLEIIGPEAFYACPSLSDIKLSPNLKSIGPLAFEITAYYFDMSNWDDGVLYIGDCLIQVLNKEKSHVEVKEGTRLIADMAFSGSFKGDIFSIVLPETIEVIGNNAFVSEVFEVYNLSEVDIASITTNIKNIYTTLDTPTKFIPQGDYMFYCDEDEQEYLLVDYRGESTNLVLPESINGKTYNIYPHAFQYNKTITEVVLPDTVTEIADTLFDQCYNLEKITLGSGVIKIGHSAFRNCSKLNNIILPSGVTSIGEEAFAACSTLESIHIPEGVTEIKEYTFGGCTSLKEVTFGSGLKSIGNAAFGGCENLSEIVLPETIEKIDRSAFAYSGITYIQIPDSVKSIEDCVFESCKNLESIVIGSGIEKIMNFAFMESDALDAIYYKGSAEDWNKVECGEKVFLDSSATVYFYSETEPTTAGNFWHYVDGVPTKW